MRQLYRVDGSVACAAQEADTQWVKILGAILMLVDIVVGTFIFVNLIVAVAANTLVSKLTTFDAMRMLVVNQNPLFRVTNCLENLKMEREFDSCQGKSCWGKLFIVNFVLGFTGV